MRVSRLGPRRIRRRVRQRGAGMLTVFQRATLAGWAQVMYRVMDAGAETAVPYFVLLVLFGPYFVVNLFLAVLKTKFGKARVCFAVKSWRGGR